MKKIILFSLVLISFFGYNQTNDTIKINIDSQIYEFVGTPAEYPGGMEALYKYLANEIAYPNEAKDKGIQGKVYVKFVIEKDGSVGEIQIINKGQAHPSLETESFRVISLMPKWTPATNEGKIVRSWFTIPINFTLHDGKVDKKKKRKSKKR
jgi:periplasmic protein TonB